MNLNFRNATKEDISELIKLLSNDRLGAKREDASKPLNRRYINAIECIEKDPNNELTIVESNGDGVGMLQLTFIPTLTHMGSRRCLIESVRISKEYRSQGLGTNLINWAIARAKMKGCGIVQLTSDKQRPDALRFYESLGFQATHEGFKLKL